MSFDALAPWYRKLEWLLAGEKLQRCREVLLPQLVGARHVLIAGEGPGRWLEVAGKALPAAHFTVVDASEPMLQLAAKHWLNAGGVRDRLTLVHGSLPEVATSLPPSVFDVIVTPFFLDCFDGQELRCVVAALAHSAAPGARWLVCDFRVPISGPARWRAQAVLSLAYRFFRLVTRLKARQLEDPAPLLREHDFCLEREVVSEWGLLSASLWQRGAANCLRGSPEAAESLHRGRFATR